MVFVDDSVGAEGAAVVNMLYGQAVWDSDRPVQYSGCGKTAAQGCVVQCTVQAFVAEGFRVGRLTGGGWWDKQRF